MLYYARINEQIVGPLGRSELIRLRDDGTLGAAGQWCAENSETWQSTETIDSIPSEIPHVTLGLFVTLNQWTLTAFTLVLLLMPLWGGLSEPATVRSVLYLYAGFLVIAILTRSISGFGLLFRGFLLVAAIGYSIVLREAIEFAASQRTSYSGSSSPSSEKAISLFEEDASLPNLQPLPYSPQPSAECFDLYSKHSPTRFSEYSHSMAKLRPTFTQTNERDTLTVERARYYAENIANLPYNQYMDWNNLYETLKTKEGNCATKSIALYDMMKRGGAKNVFWVVGMCYKSPINDTPIPHAWVYWEKDDKRYLIESTAPGMFHDITEVRNDTRLSKFYSNYWPRWGISEGRYYVFGR